MHAAAIYATNRNPALVLYGAWKSTLTMFGSLENTSNDLFTDGSRWSSSKRAYPIQAWGQPGLGICVLGFDLLDRPVIGFGQVWDRYGRGCWPMMALDARGRFTFANPYGDKQRNMMESTFLEWGRYGTRVQWFVKPSVPHSGLAQTTLVGRIPYIPTNLVQWGHWWKLTSHATGWQIVASNPKSELHVRWKAACALRERRYDRHAGIKKVSAQPPRLMENNMDLDPAESVRRLAALLYIDRPAPTTPMIRQRPEEAHHDHMVTPHDPSTLLPASQRGGRD